MILKEVLVEGLILRPVWERRTELPWLVVLPEKAFPPAMAKHISRPNEAGKPLEMESLIWADREVPGSARKDTAADTSRPLSKSDRKVINMTAIRFTKAKIRILFNKEKGRYENESGTRSSVSLFSAKAAAQTVRPATFIANPSLQDCDRTSRPQTCGRPNAPLATAARLSHYKGEAVTVSSRLFRALRPLHNRQLTVLVYPPPAPHGERIIAREALCQRECKCLESAKLT